MAPASLSLLFFSSPSPPPHLRLHPHRPPPTTTAASATDYISTSTSASTSNLSPKVVVTRERGKNAKLITALLNRILQRPCVSEMGYGFSR
ncbi:hypothetical protein RIF29_12743 [Crotalaria pallida]|uniref:Uncharacterized protein n=1 Tax=Crotalaria pallida TaxID=3830 RepID=A0AAN9INH3_CROPI